MNRPRSATPWCDRSPGGRWRRIEAQRDAHRQRIAFSEQIPLSGFCTIGTHEVRGPLTFTPCDPEIGGSCKLTLIADGVHVPSFPQWLQAPGRYNNAPGANDLEFLFLGGSLFFIKITSAPAPRSVR